MKIIIFGPPLAGKGTQCKNIIDQFNYTHLSTGDALRAEKKQKTDLGNEAAEYSSQGLLAPDELVARVVEKFYLNHRSDKGILFDGYPRNIDQANHLLNVLKEDNSSLDMIIYLKVAKEQLFQRAEVRAKKENRKDDADPEIVRTRIEEFERLTIPAINHIEKSGVRLVEIDGNQTIEEISNLITKALS